MREEAAKLENNVENSEALSEPVEDKPILEVMKSVLADSNMQSHGAKQKKQVALMTHEEKLKMAEAIYYKRQRIR